MPPTLRPYRPADEAALVAAWDASARLAYPFCDEAFFEQGARDIVNVFLPMAETTVCVVDGRVVGFASMLGNTMGGLFVDPAYCGRGLGRALVDHVAQNRDALDLTVFTKNRIGRAFYARYGFRECGPRELHAESGHELMRLCWERAQQAGPD